MTAVGIGKEKGSNGQRHGSTLLWDMASQLLLEFVIPKTFLSDQLDEEDQAATS